LRGLRAVANDAPSSADSSQAVQELFVSRSARRSRRRSRPRNLATRAGDVFAEEQGMSSEQLTRLVDFGARNDMDACW